MQEFSQLIIHLIKNIPVGRVTSYGRLAAYAGQPSSARQVSRILHSCTNSHQLPWHRVVNAQGRISLSGEQGSLQRKKLETEGVIFNASDTINLTHFLWNPGQSN